VLGRLFGELIVEMGGKGVWGDIGVVVGCCDWSEDEISC
jgi:hypothetical protein